MNEPSRESLQLDLDALQAVAEATQEIDTLTEWYSKGELVNFDTEPVDAEYIAALPPKVAMALIARVREAEAKLDRVREYLVAIQNSPGLGNTGHHNRWLREALAVLDAEGAGDD